MRMSLLEGIKVVDLSQVAAGPMATTHLGDLGAEVIKIERPDGELSRGVPPMVDGISGYYGSINRNKLCITLDLSTDEGKDIFEDVVKDADVLLENFKGGSVKKLGIDYDTVTEVNEEIIYCSVKGFGSKSPYEGDPAFDMIIQAMGGALSITGEEGGPPIHSKIAMGDFIPAMYAVEAILSAIYNRDVNDGGGEHIEISMLDAMISWLGPRAIYSLIEQKPYPRSGTKHRAYAPYKIFETSDSYIVVGVASQYLWPKFCKAVDRVDLVEMSQFATTNKRSKNQDELYDILDSILQSKSTQEWFDIFQEYGVPAGPVYDTLELWEDPHVLARDVLNEEYEIPLINYPANFSEHDTDVRIPPKGIGEDTDWLMRNLGYSRERIEYLKSQDII